VPVYDLGLDDQDVPYFAMKRTRGMTLAEVLAARADGDAEALARWPRRTLLARVVDVCEAIQFAHSRGVVHRDLKPSNIMLGEYGEVYVLDWGVARVDNEASLAPPSLSDDLPDEAPDAATKTGALLGTPGYMSPEQLRGQEIGPQTDIYALGCILFEILVGRPALPRGTVGYLASLEPSAHRPHLRHPEMNVAPELDDICARATEPSTSARYQSVSELATALNGYLTGDRDTSRRRELAAHHATAARDAAAAGNEAGRALAMQQAGRALALDPENRSAQTVLAQVLLEPPSEMPAAVRDSVDRARNDLSRAQLRAASRAYLGYLSIVPALIWLGIREVWPIVIMVVLIIAGAIVTGVASRRRGPLGIAFYLVLGIQAAFLAMVGIVVSPVLLLPSLVVGSLPVFISHPTTFKPVAILIGHALAFFIPFLLEAIGLVPRTFWMEGGRLIIHPWVLELAMFPLMVFVLATVPVQLIVNLLLTIHQRYSQERNEERLHLQSWHLRQLVSDPVDTSQSFHSSLRPQPFPPTPVPNRATRLEDSAPAPPDRSLAR
jgi:serine/threonine-protein kinase